MASGCFARRPQPGLPWTSHGLQTHNITLYLWLLDALPADPNQDCPGPRWRTSVTTPDPATFQMLVVALVHSRLNYGNRMLVGIPAYLLCPVADLEGAKGPCPPLLNPPTYR